MGYGVSFGMAESCNAHALSDPRSEYEPRETQSGVLYQVTRNHLDTFLEDAKLRADGDDGVPDFIGEELRKFLECGLLQGGFARFKCESCGFERLVPFSCKCRSVCSSCSGRRMASLAANMVDSVFPDVPVRQFVLTLPFALRYKMAWDHKTTRAVLGVYTRAVAGFFRKRAKRLGLSDGKTGGVTVIQRAGSGIKLNVHFHTAMLDGVFTQTDEGELEFHPTEPPSTEEIAELLRTIKKRITRLLERRGFSLGDDDSPYDELADEHPSLAGMYAASMHNIVSMGRRAGCKVIRVGQDPFAEVAFSRSKRHAHIEGFDLHANTTVKAGDREGLEKLLRYLLRPAIAKDRLTLLDDGRILVELKNKWADGTTHLLYEPIEFLEKIAAIIPRPHINLVIYNGVLAPNAKLRKQVVAYGRETDSEPENEDNQDKEESKPRHYKWADLMKRVFDLDVLCCPKCSGRLKLLALIEDPAVIKKILKHLNLPTELPSTCPARAPPKQEQLDLYAE